MNVLVGFHGFDPTSDCIQAVKVFSSLSTAYERQATAKLRRVHGHQDYVHP